MTPINISIVIPEWLMLLLLGANLLVMLPYAVSVLFAGGKWMWYRACYQLQLLRSAPKASVDYPYAPTNPAAEFIKKHNEDVQEYNEPDYETGMNTPSGEGLLSDAERARLEWEQEKEANLETGVAHE